MTNPESILSAVSAYYHISVSDLVGRSRITRIANARMIAAYLLRTIGEMTMLEVGMELGREHTTITHAVKQVRKRMILDVELAGQIASLGELLALPERVLSI